MTSDRANEKGNGAELVAHEEDANPRRQMLKQIGLAAGAVAVTTLGVSVASAQEGKAKANQSADPESRIIERALRDVEYRKRLIANPRSVIGEEVGRALPPGVQFKVVQETADTMYLVLPYLPAVGEGKLSAKDLQEDSAIGRAVGRSWFRSCPCKCSSLSVCKER